jgi:hypothetical protein
VYTIAKRSTLTGLRNQADTQKAISNALAEQLQRAETDATRARADIDTAQVLIEEARERLGNVAEENTRLSGELDQVRGVLADFDWESSGRQYALEQIDQIVNPAGN